MQTDECALTVLLGLLFGLLSTECGELVCGDCSRRKIPLPRMGYTAPERVCNRCASVDDAKNYVTGSQQRRRVMVPDATLHPFLVYDACKMMAAASENDPLWTYVFPTSVALANRSKVMQEFFWQWIFFAGSVPAAVHMSYAVPEGERDDISYVKACALLYAPGMRASCKQHCIERLVINQPSTMCDAGTFVGAFTRMASMLNSDPPKWGAGAGSRLLLAIGNESVANTTDHAWVVQAPIVKHAERGQQPGYLSDIIANCINTSNTRRMSILALLTAQEDIDSFTASGFAITETYESAAVPVWALERPVA
jgi:hypothetical protein